MKKIVVSFKDLKAKEYLFLLHFKNVDEATRFYQDAVSDSRSVMSKHPRDYVLHQLATFDTETGILSPEIPNDLTPYSYLDTLREIITLPSENTPPGSPAGLASTAREARG